MCFLVELIKPQVAEIPNKKLNQPADPVTSVTSDSAMQTDLAA